MPKPLLLFTLFALTAALLVATNSFATDKQTILYSFKGKTDGSAPESGLVLDTAGNLYGITHGGGTSDCGTVFELSPNSGGGWTETILHTFAGGNDGCEALFSNLIFDAKGNLYGETELGGAGSSGTVFELSPSSTGGWTETILYSFTGSFTVGGDGKFPMGGLVFDTSGNLYGTTLYGGIACFGLTCGTVFEVSPNSDGSWTETILHAFTGSDGLWPQSNLVFDATGNLYGTTTRGGSYDGGVVFSLSPSADGWSLNILHSFSSTEGYGPQSGVIFDYVGNLYGTSMFGSRGYQGTVYELTPTGGFPWTETLLHQFTDNGDGAWPIASLTLDRWGNLYGTTSIDINPADAFKISSAGTGRTFTVLHVLPGSSVAPLIRDAAGNMYGTTQSGGQRSGYGSVFELSPVK